MASTSHARIVDAPTPDDESSFCPRPVRPFVLVAAILASAMGFIDGSVVSIAIPAIRTDLGASLADAEWVSNAYMLALSAVILVGGAAGDRFGLRRTFASGIGLFVAASLAAAAAPGVVSLVVARGIQGLGAAFMVPASLAIIAKAFPRDQRGRAIGLWIAASALTTSLGPVVGGFILSVPVDSVWRVIFAVNLPLGGAAIFLLLAKVPADRPAGHRRLDLAGAVLAVLAFGTLAYGLTASTVQAAPWGGLLTPVCLAAAAVLLAAFVLWESRNPQPMVALSLFRIPTFAGANAVTFFLYVALSGNLFYLPMLLIAGWGLSAATVGFIFLPMSGAIALLSGPVGRLADRIGPRLPMTVGSGCAMLAFSGMAVAIGAHVHVFWTAVWPLMLLFGLGMGLVVTPLSTAVMMAVEDKDSGSASGINNALARVAGLVAVAAMGVVAALVYRSQLGAQAGILPGFGEPAQGLGAAADALRIAAGDAAFSAVAWCHSALAALAALISWFTVPGSKPPKKQRSEQS